METTALGAAYLAGLAVGYWKDIAEIQQLWKVGREFAPVYDEAKAELGLKGWKKAIHAAQAAEDIMAK